MPFHLSEEPLGSRLQARVECHRPSQGRARARGPHIAEPLVREPRDGPAVSHTVNTPLPLPGTNPWMMGQNSPWRRERTAASSSATFFA